MPVNHARSREPSRSEGTRIGTRQEARIDPTWAHAEFTKKLLRQIELKAVQRDSQATLSTEVVVHTGSVTIAHDTAHVRSETGIQHLTVRDHGLRPLNEREMGTATLGTGPDSRRQHLQNRKVNTRHALGHLGTTGNLRGDLTADNILIFGGQEPQGTLCETSSHSRHEETALEATPSHRRRRTIRRHQVELPIHHR